METSPAKSKKEKVECRIVVTLTETEINVTFSDWLKVNPRKLDRIRDAMGKAWRKERAHVIHEDRVESRKAAAEDQAVI